MRFRSHPFERAKSSVLTFSEIAPNQAVMRDADRSGPTFNLPPGNASLSMSPDARHAAFDISGLSAHSERQSYSQDPTTICGTKHDTAMSSYLP
jgi:hypothetical protein